ncbi:MAG: hypothetical protein ACI4MS_05315 [Candidatus Coproplasma sp.]
MWNENAPLELLKTMPNVLTEENLANIQSVIDVDKYENSYQLGQDLCGTYAPFCNGCDKTVNCPCAVAYVKMKQAEGMDVAIAETKTEAKPKKTTTKKTRVAVAKKKK